MRCATSYSGELHFLIAEIIYLKRLFSVHLDEEISKTILNNFTAFVLYIKVNLKQIMDLYGILTSSKKLR